MATSYRPEEHGSQDDRPDNSEAARDTDAGTRIDSDATTNPDAARGPDTAREPDTIREPASTPGAEPTRDLGAARDPRAGDSGNAPTRVERARDDAATSHTTAGTAAAPAPAASADHGEATTRIGTRIDAQEDHVHSAPPRDDLGEPVLDDATEARREAAARLGIARIRNRPTTDFGLLVLRVLNVVLFLHGLTKAMAYSGFRDAVAANELGQMAPNLIAILVVAGQLILPIAIAVGLFTRLSGLLQAIMMGIIWVFPLAGGLIDPETGAIVWESAYLFTAIGLTLVFTGPGRMSLDQLIFAKSAERRAARRAEKKLA